MTEEDRLKAYIDDASGGEPKIIGELRARTRELAGSSMILGAASGRALRLLAQLIGANKYLEVGTFTGFSSLTMALALPADGEIVCCDVSKEYTDIARAFWQKAGVDAMIELRLGPAVETLQDLIDEGRAGQFDIAFIDADKPGYAVYFDLCFELVRRGGLIVCDNVLWGGSVIDPGASGDSVAAIRAFNEKLRDDARIDATLLEIGDGLFACRKL